MFALVRTGARCDEICKVKKQLIVVNCGSLRCFTNQWYAYMVGSRSKLVLYLDQSYRYYSSDRVFFGVEPGMRAVVDINDSMRWAKKDFWVRGRRKVPRSIKPTMKLPATRRVAPAGSLQFASMSQASMGTHILTLFQDPTARYSRGQVLKTPSLLD